MGSGDGGDRKLCRPHQKLPPERKDFPRPGEDVAQRQKGESGARSASERVLPPPPAPPLPTEAGAADAVRRTNPSRENAMPGGPQTARHCSIQNIFSAEDAQSNAARILNRPSPHCRVSGTSLRRHIILRIAQTSLRQHIICAPTARIPNRPTQQGSCGLFYPFSGTKPTRSLTTSPPMISPATEGTKALEPGTVRRAVHLRWVPGGQMQ